MRPPRERPAVCLVRPSLPQMPQKNAFSKWGLRLRTHIFRWGENMNANRRNALLTIGVGIVLWFLPGTAAPGRHHLRHFRRCTDFPHALRQRLRPHLLWRRLRLAGRMVEERLHHDDHNDTDLPDDRRGLVESLGALVNCGKRILSREGSP